MPKSPIRPRLELLMILIPIFAASRAPATDVPVSATGGSVFSPRDVALLVGDTVTWTRLGGFHNMNADDGTFRCAAGCDQTGGNGDASMSWSTATFQFIEPDLELYHCEVHGAPGGIDMSGTVKVLRAIFADGFEGGGSEPEEWAPIVPVGDTCANPILVGGGWNTQDLLAGASNDLDLTANELCGGQGAHGRDRVYQVDTLGNDIVATVTPLDPGFDPVLYILDGIGGCPTSTNLSCVEFSNSGGPGGVETLNVNVSGSQTYYIVVDTLSASTAGSAYNINISLVP